MIGTATCALQFGLPDSFQEDALGGALPHINGRHPGATILIWIDQQISHLILVYLYKVHLQQS